MLAVASLLIVVVISLLVTRVATVILTATGISRQNARFLARSAFTTAGFATRQWDEVLEHPVRRRVLMSLMLLGNAGLVVAASSLILSFRSAGNVGQQWVRVVELVGGLLALWVFSRNARVDRWLTSVIGRQLRRFSNVHGRDVGTLFELPGSYCVKELAVRPNDWVVDRSLGELRLRDEGIVVLGLTRSDGTYTGAPTGSTTIQSGDLLVVYGREQSLDDLDRRSSVVRAATRLSGRPVAAESNQCAGVASAASDTESWSANCVR